MQQLSVRHRWRRPSRERRRRAPADARLTVRHDGIDRRLTDVHGHVIHDIIA